MLESVVRSQPNRAAIQLLKSKLKTERLTNRQQLKGAAVQAWQRISSEESQHLAEMEVKKLKGLYFRYILIDLFQIHCLSIFSLVWKESYEKRPLLIILSPLKCIQSHLPPDLILCVLDFTEKNNSEGNSSHCHIHIHIWPDNELCQVLSPLYNTFSNPKSEHSIKFGMWKNTRSYLEIFLAVKQWPLDRRDMYYRSIFIKVSLPKNIYSIHELIHLIEAGCTFYVVALLCILLSGLEES